VADQSHAPRTTPAAQDLPGLVVVYVHAFTSLGPMLRPATRHASQTPVRLHFPRAMSLVISPYETRSSGYRRRAVFAVRHRLRMNLPVRAFAPFTVELFAAARLMRSPSLVTSPAAFVAKRWLPALAEVERTLRDFHPISAGESPRFGPNPLGGFATRLPRVAHPLLRLRPRHPSARTHASPTMTRFFSVAQSFTDIPWSRT